MEKHTNIAVLQALGLFLVATPALLMIWAFSGIDKETGRMFGPIIFVASAFIWWFWLRADAPLHHVQKSTAIIALLVYLLVFVLAIVGYLFYSRGLSRGFTSVSWFVLLFVGTIAAVAAEMALLNAIFSGIPIAF
jgi:hypothetical protein